MKQRSFWLTALLLTALCAALVLSAVFCMTSAFSLQTSSYLPLLTVLCCAVFCTVFGTKRGWIAFLAFAALLLAAFFFRLREIRESFSALADHLIGIFNAGYHWFLDPDFAQNVSAESIRTALTCLCIAMSLLVSFSAAYLKNTLLCGMFVLPCVISCFVLTDTPPRTVFFLTVLFCVLLLALTQRSRRTEPSRTPVSLLWFALPAALLLAVLCIAAPQERYDHTALVGGMTAKINSAWEDVRGGLISGTRSDSPTTVDLHAQKNAPASNRTVLRVTAERADTLYLAGMAYSAFSGDSWTAIKQLRQTSPAKLTISALPSRLDISAERVSNVLYTPYGLVECDADTGVYDAYRENGGELKDYTVRYYPTDNTALWVTPEEEYTDLVLQSSCALPEDTKAALLLWGKAHLPENPTPAQIADAVRQSAVYSRYPKAIPADADLAVYFLNEAESGFCVHFATATAELLRAYGYPSRYVTGYLVTTKAGETVNVPEKNAHAWAEYYDTELGWVCLDATPSEGVQRQTEESQPHPVMTEEQATEDTTEPTETRPERPQDRPGGKENKTDPLPSWVWVLLAALLMIGLLLLRRAVCRAVRNRRLNKGLSNERLCARWRYYERLCKLCGTPADGELYQLAQKAKYSPYRTTAEELRQMEEAVEKQKTYLRNAPLPKRLYVKYLLAAL